MMAENVVDAILGRFPGPVTLRGSRLKMLAVLLISLGFVVIGGLLTVFAKSDPEAVMAGIGGVLFFGACALVGAVMLLPGAAGLTLDADGFEVCSLFRRTRTAWPQASRFTVTTLKLPRPQRMVGYDNDSLKGFAAEFSLRSIGRNAALADGYGLPLEDLARLLTEWRELALARRVHSPVPQVKPPR